MKTLSLTIASLLVAGIFSSCGKDGQPGTATLALDWDWYVDGFNDNNPSTPETVSRNQAYSANPGSYKCQYVCSDGNGNVWYYSYDYSISINKGTSARTFKKGVDGKDKAYKLFMTGMSNASLTFTEKSGQQQPKQLKSNLDDFKLPEGKKKVCHGKPETIQYTENNSTITVTRQLFTME